MCRSTQEEKEWNGKKKFCLVGVCRGGGLKVLKKMTSSSFSGIFHFIF